MSGLPSAAPTRRFNSLLPSKGTLALLVVTGAAIAIGTALAPCRMSRTLSNERHPKLGEWYYPAPGFPERSTFADRLSDTAIDIDALGAITETASEIGMQQQLAEIDRKRLTASSRAGATSLPEDVRRSLRDERLTYIALLQVGPSRGEYLMLRASSGWPLRCLRGFVAVDNVGQDQNVLVRGASANVSVPQASGRVIQIWPMRPLVWGMTGNVVLYTLVILFARYCALQVRRAVRRARGLCADCGYDARGNMSPVCPECGRIACQE